MLYHCTMRWADRQIFALSGVYELVEGRVSDFSIALLAQGSRYQSTQVMAGTITCMHRLLDTVA